MSGQRALRIAEQIKKEIADILKRELKDPRIGFVSVTDVELSKDLRHAKVFVSIYGDAEAQRETEKALLNATPFVRREIGKRVPLRYTPEIVFKLDYSIARGARVAELLQQIAKEREEKESAHPGQNS